MKKLFGVLLLAMVFFAVPGFAQSVTGEVGVSTHYIDRGVEASTDPSIGLDVRADDFGVSGGFVSLDLNSLQLDKHNIRVRSDLGLGYQSQIGDSIFDAGVAVHHLDNTVFNGGQPYSEGRVVVGARVIPELRLFVEASQPFTAVSNDTYYGAGATYNPVQKLAVTAQANFYRRTGGTYNSFNNAEFSASYSLLDHVKLFGLYSYAHDRQGLYGNPDLANTWEVGTALTF